MSNLLIPSGGVRYKRDGRSWRQRVETVEKNWAPHLPHLVDAYLAWRQEPSGAQRPDVDLDYSFTINVVDVYTLGSSAVITRPSDQSAAEALVRCGYLSNSPMNPSLAISLKTLELFRCLKLVKASFSAEAFAKLVCYQYHVPYRPYYRNAIADAFDVYLTIQRLVSQRVMGALGRDLPDWRARHGCPACAYTLDDEDPGVFSRIICMDANNSLKRTGALGKRAIGDTRQFTSDYFLPPEFVNRYANEVKSRQNQPAPNPPPDQSDSDDEAHHNPAATDGEGDPTDGSGDLLPTPCAKHWKAAQAEERKHMWSIFDETGIFACACRHGLVLWIADMIRSGELAKYPLAMVAKAHEVLGARLMIGYDIGCDFSATVRNSSLAATARELGTRFCVNAFHGYSHSYSCQVAFHPNSITGIGLEDLEGMERIFSSSNQLAPIVRYASKYRRASLIDLFFQQWDAEKYANLGAMLFNNLKQALEIVQTQEPALEDALKSLNISREDIERFYDEERKFILELRDEQDTNLHAVAYVEALQELQSVRYELDAASRRFNSRAPDTLQISWADPRTGATDYDADLSATRKAETRRRYLRERLKQLTEEVATMEAAYNIETRWQPEDATYRQTLQYMATRKYQRALGKLQRLVILRLFELHKMNLAQTGYRMRTYIAKNLQRRCKAIRRAVREYNAAAQALEPPRNPLDWSKVSHYTFLEEFTLLQDTRQDLLQKPWVQPAIRETMRIARRVARAHEEIANVNREARRLHTHIRDEEDLLSGVLSDLKTRGDPLYFGVLEYSHHRRAANARNLAYLQRMFTLNGFTGNPLPGVRAGSAPASAAAHAQPPRAQAEMAQDSQPPGAGATSLTKLVSIEEGVLEHEESDASAESDHVHEEITGILEFLASLRT
ncbi:hypothetical protein C8Q73DRAFT_639779 [Cubamyces lactineus]|nr:hypothetical protein C8Q73DRAFT_639779 [Cubamyces lactineus]